MFRYKRAKVILYSQITKKDIQKEERELTFDKGYERRICIVILNKDKIYF